MVCSLSCLSSHSPLAIYPDHFQEPSIVIDLCNEEGDVSELDSVSIISPDSENEIEIVEVEMVTERHCHKQQVMPANGRYSQVLVDTARYW